MSTQSRPISKPYRAWMRSLRFRLTAWFTGILALALLALAALLLLGAWHTLRGETDAFLLREAQHVTSSEAGDSEDGPETPDLARAVASETLSPADQRPRHHLNSLLLFDAVYLRLLDPADGKAVATSPSLSRRAALVSALDAIPRPRPGAVSPSFCFAGPSEEDAVRVLTETIRVGPRPMTLQVAVPWDHTADVLERLGLLLAVALPAVLLAAAVGGWALVGRTLQPIQRIVTEAEALDVNAPPRELLPAPAETDSEIGHLVATLNRMTTRLHEAFAAQRGFAEAQQRFAADSSHELRTPLTILRGEMELALTRPRSPEAYQSTIASGIEEIIRMSRIVEGLSFLARHDARRLQSRDTHTALDLSRLTRKATADFEMVAREKRIALHHSAVSGPVVVQGDEVQLQQLVANLVENAVKYTPPGGSVCVSVVPGEDRPGPDRRCRVRVEDTGIGIAEKDLPHVFDRFWRADLARTSGGSGLGLAICAQIAWLHHGELRVTSRLAHGTVVELTLPAVAEH